MQTCVVLGMHRSGTSLAARAVNLMGWSLGDEDQLIPPAGDNERGFWESSPIVTLNDRLLSALGGSWDAPPTLAPGWEHGTNLPSTEEAQALLVEVFGDADARAWKDPRTSLLVPWWRRVTPIDRVVVVLRDPDAVAASLATRSGMDADWACYLWLRHVGGALTAHPQPAIIAYEAALADPKAFFLGLGDELDADPDDEALATFLAHVDRDSRPSREPVAPESDVAALARRLHADALAGSLDDELLACLASGLAADHPDLEPFARVHADLARTRAAAAPLVEQGARIRPLRRRVESLERENAELRRRVARLEQTGKASRGLEGRLRKAEQEETRQRRRAVRAEKDLQRLRQRRVVRLALGAAGAARPLFRLRRGQLSRQSDEKRQSTDAAQRVRGLIHDVVDELVARGAPPEFSAAWEASEARLPSPAELGPDQPLVTVILPTHNRAGILADAIRSVREQTWTNWELLVCDDGSTDDTPDVVAANSERRVRHLQLEHRGAAAARNAGLAAARGELIAYLDSDNAWHPRFLEVVAGALATDPGRWCAYSTYVDVMIDGDDVQLHKAESLPFDWDRLAEKNFMDLNTFVHRRILIDHVGGFDEHLLRQQDWDLILRCTFLREPVHVNHHLLLYRRNPAEWDQITYRHRKDTTSPDRIRAAIERHRATGLDDRFDESLPSLSILSWDICRNHLSKAWNLAEAMALRTRVRTVGFRFFEEPIFGPYASATPTFETHWLDGDDFPHLNDRFARAIALAGHSDVIYAVKPRLPSLGVGLLANHQFGKPLIVECNDLETVVTSPSPDQAVSEPPRLADVDPADPRLLDPWGELWTGLMEGLARRLPWRTTHNAVLDAWLGGGSHWIRNPKDEAHFDPRRHDREAIRRRFGIDATDRVLLFGGMVRRHKGVFELLPLLGGDSTWRLLVVGSRTTPDEERLREQAGDRVTFVDTADRNEMAAVNAAADAVVLWLDPDVPASRFQMPFKLTDALAMRVPVVANDIGDLGDLGRAGFLRLAPFGDIEALRRELDRLVADPEGTRAMTDRGRGLYMREFSYAATRLNLAMLTRLAARAPGPLPVAEEFATFFAAFQQHARQARSPGAAP